jgi:hypothetical protein
MYAGKGGYGILQGFIGTLDFYEAHNGKRWGITESHDRFAVFFDEIIKYSADDKPHSIKGWRKVADE